DNKANLELLTDEKYGSRWSPDERQLIRKYVLPTWRLTADSAHFAKGNREQLVLKPCAQFAGRGVLIGEVTSEAEWDAAIERCSAGAVTHVIQWKADAPQIITRASPTGIIPYVLCLGPILFGDELAGIYARQKPFDGEIPIINAKAGAEAG